MVSWTPTVIGEPERILFASPAFRDKLARALAVVSVALRDARAPYVALSGGKDSMVVLALAGAVLPDIEAVWSDDELEYPETVAFMSDLGDLLEGRLRVTLGWAEHAGWFRPWRAAPPFRQPFRGARRVGMDLDDWMGREGYDLTLLGTRAGESRKRRDWLRAVYVEHGVPIYPVKGGTGRRCCPIWDWTEDDVWTLIAGWGLRYNSAYDRLAAIGQSRERQRVGPLPLSDRATLAAGWPELLARLEARYGPRWS